MTSFHTRFANLLESRTLAEWRDHWSPTPTPQTTCRLPAAPSTVSDTDARPQTPPQLHDGSGQQSRHHRAFFLSPLTSDTATCAVTTHTVDAPGAPRHEFAGYFYQVVKEVAFAFTLLAVQQTLIEHADDPASSVAPHTPADVTSSPILSSRAVLQARMRHAAATLAERMLSEEVAERAMAQETFHALQKAQEWEKGDTVSSPLTAQQAELRQCIEEATSALVPFHRTRLLTDSQVADSPRRWAGHPHFNPLTLNLKVDVVAPSVTTAAVTRTVMRCRATTAALPLFLSEDVSQQMAVYWRLHNEAEARARLHALKNKDASAYAEHVSLLKISALLQVMEKTHDFMMRIGMSIRKRLEEAGGITVPSSAEVAVLPSVDHDCTDPAATPASATSCTEYQRFKAYVASASGDFKLVHPIDSFVANAPAGLRATLLPHQMDGLRFLASLHTNHINGILADEMGVGKTIQTLAFLLHLKEALSSQISTLGEDDTARAGDVVSKYNRGRRPTSTWRLPPHLVLAPLSVVREWKEACEQFVPDSMRVAVWNELSDPVAEAPLYDLVLLPIHAVRRLSPEAMRIQFGYVVVDEAHKAVANLHTATAACILRLRFWRRLVLTGTPLNSDLQELWSLLHFLNPDVFSTADSFDEVFRRPFAVYDAREMDLTSEERGLLVLRLHQILRPFMLRRTKKDVDRTLHMVFSTFLCPLTAVQTELLRLLREERRTPACSLTALHTGSACAEESEDSPSEDDGDDSDAAVRCQEKQGTAPLAGQDHALRAVREAQVTRAAQAATRYWLTNNNVSESTAQALCNHGLSLPFVSQVMHANGMVEQEPARIPAFASPPASFRKQPELAAGDDVEAVAESGEEVRRTPRSPAPPPIAPVRGAAELALACSGKFLVLDLLLTRLAIAKRKAVLFTHWLDCLDLLTDFLVSRGWGENVFEVLSGSTSEEERRARVHRFRTDPSCLFFLLSIKAGGCGVNLQVAHVVIMLDRDYTTTNEDQALARVYRIGQRHTVRAVYLTTTDPAEARIAARAEVKNKPRQAIIEDGTYRVVHGDGDSRAETEHSGESLCSSPSVGDSPLPRASASHNADEDSSLPNVPNDGATAASTLALTVWRALMRPDPHSALATLPSPLSLQNRQADPQGTEQATQNGSALLCEAFECILDGYTVPEGSPRPTSDGDKDEARRTHVDRFVTSAAWSALHALVCELDDIVCTEEDVATGAVRRSLWRHRPPTCSSDFNEQWRREVAGAHVASAVSPTAGEVSEATPRWQNAHEWGRVLLTWLDAIEGPLLIQHALQGARANSETRQDVEYMRWCKQQRHRRRDARLALLRNVHPPMSFKEQCWQDGVEDDVRICRLYVRAQQKKRERKETAERVRAARREERAERAAARAVKAATRRVHAEAREALRQSKVASDRATRPTKRHRTEAPAAATSATVSNPLTPTKTRCSLNAEPACVESPAAQDTSPSPAAALTGPE